jgi:hypothetical protein
MDLTDVQEALEQFEMIAADLGQSTNLLPPKTVVSDVLPDPLKLLYALCNGGDAILVDLLPQEQVIADRALVPFAPDWFPFASDRLGVMWLCARQPEESKWFTTWDHESGAEIDGAVFSDLSSMIIDCYQESLEGRAELGDRLVVSIVPAEAKIKAVLLVKSLAGLSTQDALSMVSSLPLSLPVKSASDAKAAMDELRSAGVECHLALDFF